MNRSLTTLTLGILLIGVVGYLARTTDEFIEVNAMTGSIRTKMRYAYVFNTPWKVHPTWVEESAARQGVSTEGGWQYLSVVSERLLSTLHECGRAPASYPLSKIGPDFLNLKTTDEIDHFVHDFVFADESKRKEMLAAP